MSLSTFECSSISKTSISYLLLIPAIMGTCIILDVLNLRGLSITIMIILFVSSIILNISTNLIPFIAIPSSRSIMFTILFNTSIAEILNATYYITSICFSQFVFHSPAADVVRQSLLEKLATSESQLAFDHFLSVVSSCFSLWMSYYVLCAVINRFSTGKTSEMTSSNVVVTWLGSFASLFLLYIFQITAQALFWIMFIFRSLCCVFMLYSLIRTSSVLSRHNNRYFMQTKLYITISIIWHAAYMIDDGTQNKKYMPQLSIIASDALYGYLPVSATFVKLLLNGIVYYTFNPHYLKKGWKRTVQCGQGSGKNGSIDDSEVVRIGASKDMDESVKILSMKIEENEQDYLLTPHPQTRRPTSFPEEQVGSEEMLTFAQVIRTT
jgi:hypothetical protein